MASLYGPYRLGNRSDANGHLHAASIDPSPLSAKNLGKFFQSIYRTDP